ncbi:hypothetical protein ACOSQ3_018820 [Xanthoceras sorbifolium]
MLKSSQPTTFIPISPQVTSAAKDAFKLVKKKQKMVEGSSIGVEISLPAGVTAFNDYKALIRRANQLLLSRDAQLLSYFGVPTTIDCGIANPFQAVQERDTRLEELKRRHVTFQTLSIN